MLNVFLFGICQILVQVLFKWGCVSNHYYLSFVLANAISIGSTCFLMAAYKQMNPNVAFGLCIGIAFLLSQIALSLVFKSSFAFMQWLAILLVTLGILLFCMASPVHEDKDISGGNPGLGDEVRSGAD